MISSPKDRYRTQNVGILENPERTVFKARSRWAMAIPMYKFIFNTKE